MVFPLIIGAALSAAGSIGGGIMGANAQEESNKTNQLINIMNSMMRERERIDQMEMAGKVRREDKLGGIDASGNRTYFDPQRGWVVDATAENEEIQDLQNREQALTLYQDLPLKRKQSQKNYVDQLRDSELEDKYINELQYAKVDPDAIRSQLFKDAQSGIDGSFDESTAVALRGATRRDPRALGNILSSFARQKADATGDAFSKTGLQATQLADQMTKSNTSQLQNLINFFGGRARGLPAVSYSKDNGDAEANNLMKQMMAGAQNSEGLVTTAAGNKGGSFDYVTPNLGYANTLTQAGQSIGNIFKSFGGMGDMQDATKRFNASNSYG